MPSALTDSAINAQADNMLAFLRRQFSPADAALILTTLAAKFIVSASIAGDVDMGLRVFTASLMTTLATQEKDR